jgi:penicillin-binding protein 1A
MRFVMRLLGFLFAAGALIGIIAAVVITVFVIQFSKDLPDHAQLQNYEPPVMTRVHAADGTLIAEYYDEKRLYLPYSSMPKMLIQSFISAEDKNFFKHGGIDPEGVARALLSNFSRGTGGRQQGASTITQQVAKNFFLTNEQSFDRKAKEALLALRIESTFSKEKILELYMNQINLGAVTGQPSYGVASAALNYFSKSVHELSISEAAYLAALPKGPNNYHPFRNKEAATIRRNYVIDQMERNGYVTAKIAEAAKAEPLSVTPRVLSPSSYGAGYFAEEVRRELADRYGVEKLKKGGLSVRTTFDPKMQAQARKALTDGLVRFDEAHGWHGVVQKIATSGDWGVTLGDVPSLSDVRPWRLAVVLSVDDNQARVGLQPVHENSGLLSKARDIGTVSGEGARLIGRRFRANLSVGDVIYVEPTDTKSTQFRLRQLPEISGAIVAMDPNTGRVHAVVGGFSFDQSQFNRATQALRQPGSSFKPFVYATALDNGYTPSSIVMDEPIEIDQGNGQGMWSPENYDGKSHGAHTLRYGIEQSKNQMTVRLARDVGMPLIAEYAKRFGIYDDLLPVLAMSLGAGETTVLRLTAAYSMLDNGGRRIKPTMIDRIQDRWGKTIYKHDERKCASCVDVAWTGQDEPRLIDKREQVIDPMTAYQITSIMEGVVQRGTAVVLRDLNKPLAGKTGTTNDAKDLWFVGYSPDLAVGVFLGYDKPRSMGDSAQAAAYAAPIFKDFMRAALADKPALTFRPPPGIKLIRVDRRTGVRTGSSDGDSIMEAFKPGTAPPDSFNGGGGGGSSSEGGEKPAKVDRSVGAGTGGLY